MKTLAELNSKWYWRLVKVIWISVNILTISIVVIWFWIHFHKSNQAYHPNNLEKVSSKIEEYENKINELTRLNKIYLSIEDLWPKLIENTWAKDDTDAISRSYNQVTRKKIIEHEKEIRDIFWSWDSIDSIFLLRSLWYDIEWVNFSTSEINSRKVYPENATFSKYLDWLDIIIWINAYLDGTYYWMLINVENTSDLIIKWSYSLKEIKASFKKILQWDSHVFIFSNYSEDENLTRDLTNLLWPKNYISLSWWIMIILYELWVIIIASLIIFLLNYFLRWIIYYMFFWIFNPEE